MKKNNEIESNKKRDIFFIILISLLLGTATLLSVYIANTKEQCIPNNQVTLYKPVIYLYPESTTDVSVSLEVKNGKITHTYPKIESDNTWNVTAYSGGKIVDSKKEKYNYLFWEADMNVKWDYSEGYCIKGSDTATFLETKLAEIGLNRKEANDFIVYWLPLMEANPYNVISFQTDIYENVAKLKINPKPDNILRVFMSWYPTSTYIEMEPQTFNKYSREGFHVVEWGGSEDIKPSTTTINQGDTSSQIAPNVPAPVSIPAPVNSPYPSWVIGVNGVDTAGAQTAYNYLKGKGLSDSQIQSNWGALMAHYAGHGTEGW